MLFFMRYLVFNFAMFYIKECIMPLISPNSLEDVKAMGAITKRYLVDVVRIGATLGKYVGI